ncbi:MAG: hypothetical protein MI796_01375 [Enterobacterales bacterium]|nr:hypothetical protein [Enterobacterales bacterium]
MPTKYYLGFIGSDDLTRCADEVLEIRANGGAQPYAPVMNELVKYFVPELLDSFLIKTADAVGLSHSASRIVHGAADTIGKASSVLVGKLLAKRSNAELEGMVSFVDDTYLHAEVCSTGANSVGCEIEKDLYDQMKRLVNDVRAGKSEEVRAELHDVMITTVDVVLEGFMLKAISLLKINFVLRKICDATVVTCRGAGHMVVNKVFKTLDEEQLMRLADYFDQLIITAES